MVVAAIRGGWGGGRERGRDGGGGGGGGEGGRDPLVSFVSSPISLSLWTHSSLTTQRYDENAARARAQKKSGPITEVNTRNAISPDEGPPLGLAVPHASQWEVEPVL